MTPEDLRAFLNQRQVSFKEEEVLNGRQFRCASGEIFVVYTTGTVNCQGQPTELLREVREQAAGKARTVAGSRPAAAAGAGPDRRVFIVYGHDTTARESLELLLHKMRLAPIGLQNLPAAGDTIIQKFEGDLGA